MLYFSENMTIIDSYKPERVDIMFITIKSKKHGNLEFYAAVCESNKYAIKYLFCNGKQLFKSTNDGRSAITVNYNTMADVVKAYHKKRMAEIRSGGRYV